MAVTSGITPRISEIPAVHAQNGSQSTFVSYIRMAEESLLPAVREADDETVVIADGTICRQQIGDGAGTRALHVARLLEQADR